MLCFLCTLFFASRGCGPGRWASCGRVIWTTIFSLLSVIKRILIMLIMTLMTMRTFFCGPFASLGGLLREQAHNKEIKVLDNATTAATGYFLFFTTSEML